MREQVLEIMVGVLPHTGPIGQCFASSLQDGAPVLAILESNLEASGLSVEHRKGKAGYWVEVKDNEGAVVAKGYDKTDGEALLQALYGALREGR